MKYLCKTNSSKNILQKRLKVEPRFRVLKMESNLFTKRSHQRFTEINMGEKALNEIKAKR